MVPDPPDMSHPVTRADLREELASYPSKADLREQLASYPTKADLREELASYPTKAELREALASYPTKPELREALASYPTKADLREELARYATKADLEVWGHALVDRFSSEMRAMEHRLVGELAQQIRSAHELFRRDFVMLDDKYKDLPPRVDRLEAQVFAPRRRRR